VKNESLTELYLIRHGETEWNIENRFQGQLDSPLSENGIRQAERLGEALSSVHFDALYSSDLGRAMHTARLLNQSLHLEAIHTDQLLRERNFGILHGLTRDEVAKQYPELSNRIWGGKAEEGIPEGESRADVHRRGVAFLDKLTASARGKRILVVSHGGIVNTIIREVLQIPMDAPRRFKLPNTGLNILILEKGSWYLRSMGTLSHLTDGTVYDETI
jgi:2,3-bisphosphoglycerate-dependent phosphoglycerate mutase